MAMLHILSSLSHKLQIKLHVAHLNHKLRGAEAREDAAFVQAAAQAMGLPCTLGEADIPAMVAEQKLSIEEAARKARYNFLTETAGNLGAGKIAVAHNADDQAETVIMHLLNGAGPEGLSGMRPALGCIVRPLLGIRRRDIEAFCLKSGISFRTDSTNADDTFLRNRIRHRLMPVLAEYNPNIVEAVLRMAEIIRTENDYLEQEAVRAWEKAVQPSAESISVLTEPFRAFDPAVQRRLVRQVFGRLAGREDNLGFTHVERAREFILSGGTGKRLELPKEVFAEKTYRSVLFLIAAKMHHYGTVNGTVNGTVTGTVTGEWEDCPLNIPGITHVPAVNAKINASLCSFEEVKELVFAAPGWEAYLDWDSLELPLRVGPIKQGQAFRPLGSGGSKKIKEFLIDHKVPKQRRKLVPVVYDAAGIVWLAGLRIDDRVKVTGRTRQVLHLQITQGNTAREKSS